MQSEVSYVHLIRLDNVLFISVLPLFKHGAALAPWTLDRRDAWSLNSTASTTPVSRSRRARSRPPPRRVFASPLALSTLTLRRERSASVGVSTRYPKIVWGWLRESSRKGAASLHVRDRRQKPSSGIYKMIHFFIPAYL